VAGDIDDAMPSAGAAERSARCACELGGAVVRGAAFCCFVFGFGFG
jgi:hypothetical protein